MAGPSGNTTRLALPYPVPADTVDVPRDVQALANKIDGLTTIVPVVTVLPSSPVDGQECFLFVDTSGSGRVWHLRYRAASSNANKWDFVGGIGLASEVSTSENITATVIATTGLSPSITVPVAGAYWVEQQATMRNNTAGQWCNSQVMRNGAAQGGAAQMLVPQPSGGPAVGTPIYAAVTLNLVAGDIISQGYNVAGGTGTFAAKFVRLTPLRVG